MSSKLTNINKNDIIHVQRPEMVIPIFFRKRNKIVCTLHGGQDIAVKNELTGAINKELDALDALISQEIKSFNQEFNNKQLNYLFVE